MKQNFVRKLVLLLVVSFSIFTLIGCAASREQMIKEVENYTLPVENQNPKNAALVYVVRPNLAGTLIRFNVFIDNPEDKNMEAGWTRGNEYIYFSLPQGVHTLYSKAENTSDLKMVAEPGKTYFIEQEVQMGIIMARNKLVPIDEVKGKYSVKKSKEGTIIKKDFVNK